MTAVALPLAAEARPWPRPSGALAIVAALLLALFARDVGDLAHIWWTSITFGHCLFIGPVVGWLAWQRRAELARLEPVAWWPGLVLVTAGAAAWLLGDAGSLALARQLGLVVMLQGAVATLLGPNVARGLFFPLAYALFLVPFGDQLESPLQALTVRLVLPLLHWSGIPAAVDGVLIHVGRYFFEVAEACSGAKFVIAMAAFAVLVAGTCFRSWPRRAAFVAVALVMPVLANGVRAFATIWAADRWSLAAATGFDHILYGWVFFGLVMAGVLALGWRWFDRGRAIPPSIRRASPYRRASSRRSASPPPQSCCWRRTYPCGVPLPRGAPPRFPRALTCRQFRVGPGCRWTRWHRGSPIIPAPITCSSPATRTAETRWRSRSPPSPTSARGANSSPSARACYAKRTDGSGSPISPR